MQPVLLQAVGMIEEIIDLTLDYPKQLEAVTDLLQGGGLEDPPRYPVALSSRPGCTVCLIEEWMRLDSYYDFILFVALVYPSSLFQKPMNRLVGTVTSYRMVFPIFRDLVVDFHTELEILTKLHVEKSGRPSTLRSVAKELCQNSYRQVAGQSFVRRLCLLEKMNQLLGLCGLYSALLAVKLPLLLLVGRLLTSELISYALHYQHTVLRSDCQALFVSPKQKNFNNLADCIAVLYRFQEHILSGDHTEAVIAYHRRLLTNEMEESLTLSWPVDNPLKESLRLGMERLKGIFSEVGAIVTNDPKPSKVVEYILKRAEEHLLYQMEQVITFYLAQAESAGVGSRARRETALSTTTIVTAGVASQRHTSTVWSSGNGPASSSSTSQGLAESLSVLRAMIVQCRCAFSLYHVVRSALPIEKIGWCRRAIEDIVSASSLNSSQPNSVNNIYFVALYSTAFLFRDLRYLTNVQATESEESQMKAMPLSGMSDMLGVIKEAVGESAVTFTGVLLTSLSDKVVQAYQEFWDYELSLANQVSPSQAGQNGKPGLESNWEWRGRIQKLVALKSQLTGTIHAIALLTKVLNMRLSGDKQKKSNEDIGPEITGNIDVYSKRYYPLALVVQKLVEHFQTTILESFRFDHQKLYKFSYVIKKFNVGIDCLNMILENHSDASVTSIKDRVMAHLVFNQLVKEIMTEGSGLIYLPYRMVFINIFLHNAFEREENKADCLPIEKFLNREELRCLVSFLGIDGLRLLEGQLLRLALDEIEDLVSLLREESGYLKLLRSQCLLSVAAANSMKHLPEIQRSLQKLGIIFALREMLFDSVHSEHRLASGSHANGSLLFATLNHFHHCVDPWAYEIPMDHYVYYSLMHSYGVTDGRDIALTDFILSIEWSEDDLSALRLLPIAAAALLVGGLYDHAQFNLRICAFEKNEHVVFFALAKLMVMIFNLHEVHHIPLLASDTKGNVSDAQSEYSYTSQRTDNPIRVSKTLKNEGDGVAALPPRTRCHDYLRSFLQYGSRVLLVAQSNELAISNHPPYQAMYFMLVYFVELTKPLLSHRDLEDFITPSFLRVVLGDLSLGRCRSTDPIIYAEKPATVYRKVGFDEDKEGLEREGDDV
eukprot:scaffold725_cov162-Ochromonas_danica.AAC.19